MYPSCVSCLSSQTFHFQHFISNNPLVSPPPSGGSLHQSSKAELLFKSLDPEASLAYRSVYFTVGIPVPVPCTFHYTVNKLITIKLCLLNCFLHVGQICSKQYDTINCFSPQVGVVQKDGKETAEDSSVVLKESPPSSENTDQEVIVEALKSICNILLHNETGQAVAADLHLINGVAERLKQCNHTTWNHEVCFFDLRLTFLLTALRVDVRAQLAQELHGIKLLGNFPVVQGSFCKQ
ncbi:hypothetical protein ILYODFUR_012776, partial [Ilyodon furcidens]